jgi:hypothetical protein
LAFKYPGNDRHETLMKKPKPQVPKLTGGCLDSPGNGNGRSFTLTGEGVLHHQLPAMSRHSQAPAEACKPGSNGRLPGGAFGTQNADIGLLLSTAAMGLKQFDEF